METTDLLCHSFYCRLCGEENKNGTNLFSYSENSDNLSLLVNKYLPIKVENDRKLPKTICPGCHIQLEATKLFLDLIIEGQSKLRQLYRTQQETLQRQAKQKQQLQRALQNVNPNSSVETYTIQTDEAGDKFLIRIFSDGPLFPPEHELSLKAEGLEKPKRKRGRPPKRPMIESEEKADLKVVENTTNEEEEADIEVDGRKRRKIKAPARFQGVVQGEELDKILKEEGVIDAEENQVEVASVEQPKGIIGRIETENGEDLGEPVFNNKPKFRSRIGFFHKKKIKRKYQCKICRSEFLHLGRYELHKKCHKLRYRCKAEGCSFENESKLRVEEHQRENGHSGIAVVEKLNTGGMIQLPVSADQVTIEDSAKESSRTNSQTYKCEHCEKSFSSRQNLNVHERSIHQGERPFTCDQCGETFAYSYSLKMHKLKHEKQNGDHEPKTYPCDMCERVLQHPSSLLYHKETEHNNGRRFVCNKCDRSFKHRQLLQRHQLVHSNNRPYVCKQCQSSFKTQANLVNHEAVHTGEKKFCCNLCGQKFAHRTSLTLHQRWHEGHKPYTCDICHKTFSQKGNLLEHRRIHTGEKPFCCELCGRSFTTSSQFNLHMKRHTGERPWSCNYCPRRFLHKDTYKAHLRRHLGDRPHRCQHCSRAFAEPWALRRHERVHSGERPYACPHCSRTFADSSNRQKHIRTHVQASDKDKSEVSVGKDKARSVMKTKITASQKNGNESNLHLTQLIDEQGNPLSITTQDGYTIPVVTGSHENHVHGLLPDGTLVPIELSELEEKEDVVEEIEINNTELLSLGDDIELLAGTTMMKSVDSTELDANMQLLANSNQEMCLLTYTTIDNNTPGISPQLALDSFLIDDEKKGQ